MNDEELASDVLTGGPPDQYLERLYRSGFVTVYEFDDGWFIQRILNPGAAYALIRHKHRRHFGFSDVRETQQIAELGHLALYVLRRANGRAHSFAFFPIPPEHGVKFYTLDWTSEERGLSALSEDYEGCRAYWLPFIMDTVWGSEEYHATWNDFSLPRFLDDRVYERLANPPPKIKKAIDQIFVEMNLKGSDSPNWGLDLEPAYDLYYPEEEEQTALLHDLHIRMLLPAFAEGAALDGLSSVWPTVEEFNRSQAWMFEFFEFRFDGDKNRYALEVWRRGVPLEGYEQIWVLQNLNATDNAIISTGTSPLDALVKARLDHNDRDFLLPSSERRAWMTKWLKEGGPTFNMAPFDMLDAPSPVLWNDARFRAWSEEEFR